MNSPSRTLLLTVLAALMPAAAQAQYYGAAYSQQPAPLYPYAVSGNQPYAVQVAPNMYEIRRPAPRRNYPYVHNTNPAPVARPVIRSAAKPHAKRFDRPPKPVDHALVEELRQRQKPKGTVINTTRIVRGPPVVIETKRYVDDPPRVIERYNVVEHDAPPATPARRKQATVEPRESGKRADTKKRVIQAEAEITIIGPDRMNIRLFRKGDGGRASAQSE